MAEASKYLQVGQFYYICPRVYGHEVEAGQIRPPRFAQLLFLSARPLLLPECPNLGEATFSAVSYMYVMQTGGDKSEQGTLGIAPHECVSPLWLGQSVLGLFGKASIVATDVVQRLARRRSTGAVPCLELPCSVSLRLAFYLEAQV